MLWIRLLCDIPGLRSPFAVPADIGNVLEHDFWWCCDGDGFLSSKPGLYLSTTVAQYHQILF